MDLNEEERAAMEALLSAALSYALCIERATQLLEQGAGHLSANDEKDIIEQDAQRAHALVEAARIYRGLNDKRARIRPAL